MLGYKENKRIMPARNALQRKSGHAGRVNPACPVGVKRRTGVEKVPPQAAMFSILWKLTFLLPAVPGFLR